MPLSNSPSPVFPSWNDVAISLFLSANEEKAIGKNDSLKTFLNKLNAINDIGKFPPSGMEQIELIQASNLERKLVLSTFTEAEIKGQRSNLPMTGNQFYLVGNTQTTEFIWVSENVKELMGLESKEDFTFMKICGMDDTDELYHPEDVEHLIRFGTCALIATALSGYDVSPFTDYYEVSFRTGWGAKHKCKTIRRQCGLSNFPEGVEGTRHFDTWCVTDGHSRFDYLHWLLHVPDPKIMALCNGMFYILNCVFIGITPQESLLANLLTSRGVHYKDEFNKKVAKALYLDSFSYENKQTYFNQKSQLKKKVDQLIFDTTIGNQFKVKPTKTSFHFRCGQLGILGMDQNLADCIWGEVR